MTYPVYLSHCDRWYRHEKIVTAYLRPASSRAVAAEFGMSDGHVRYILRLYGVARPVGRPRRNEREMAGLHTRAGDSDAVNGSPLFDGGHSIAA